MDPVTPWPGRTATGSVILPLPWTFVPPLAAVLDLPEAPLARKAELHLTLLARDEAARVATNAPEAGWRAYFGRHDWRLRLTDRWTLLHDPAGTAGAFSVIAAVDAPALNLFRRELGRAAAIDLPDTLPHVTLWVAGDTKGIGVASLAEFARRQVRALTDAEREAGIAVR